MVLDEDALHEVLTGSDVDTLERVASAFERVRGGHDLVICEGLGEVWQGRFLRASGADVVARLELGTILVARFAGARLLDDICYVKDSLKERLLGAVFNMVPESRISSRERRVRRASWPNRTSRPTGCCRPASVSPR